MSATMPMIERPTSPPLPLAFQRSLMATLGGASGTTPNWFDKTPQIFMDQITIEGKSMRIKKIAEGAFHSIYEFLDDPTKILRTINLSATGKCNVKRPASAQLKQDISELSLAKKHNIPMPICFIRPDQYDPENKEKGFKTFNGGFFVMERAPFSVKRTWKEKPSTEWTDSEWKILSFVGVILRLHITVGEEIVSDFYPRNVMLRADGSPVVIDFYNPEPIEDLKEAVWEKVRKWSGGNQEAEDFIAMDFPHEWKREPGPSPKRQCF